MQKENRYYRGPGYHVNVRIAEEFAGKYLDENGMLINTDSDEFKSDLECFLNSHNMVEEAHRTVETAKMFDALRDDEGIY